MNYEARTMNGVRLFQKVAFPAGTRPPSDAFVLRRVRECAAQAFDVDVRSLAAVAVTGRPLVVAAGLVVDRAGRVRREPHERASPPSTIESVLRRC